MINELCVLPQANRPKKVVLLARSKAKAEAAAAKLSDAGISAPIVLGDLGSPAQTFRMVEEARGALAGDGLDVMVVNAGMFSKGNVREVQEDGLEQHFALNYLHQHILIEGLSDELAKPKASRVCIMGSYTSMQFAKGKLDFDTLHSADGPVNGMIPSSQVYSHAKLAQHMHAKHLASDAGVLPPSVTVNVACPGNVPTTNLATWTEFRKKIPGPLMPAMNLYVKDPVHRLHEAEPVPHSVVAPKYHHVSFR